MSSFAFGHTQKCTFRFRAHFHAFVLKTQDIIDGDDGDGSNGNLVMIVMVIRIILLVMMMTQGKSWAWFEGGCPELPS